MAKNTKERILEAALKLLSDDGRASGAEEEDDGEGR